MMIWLTSRMTGASLAISRKPLDIEFTAITTDECGSFRHIVARFSTRIVV